MIATHLVLRVLPGPQGRVILAGTRVDASTWANRRLLEAEGFIRLYGMSSSLHADVNRTRR